MLGRLVSCSFLANEDPFFLQAQAGDVIVSRPTMSQAHQVAARVVSERCCKRFCLVKDAEVPLLCCAKEGCPKKIHTLCCQELVFKPQKAKDEEKGNVTNLLGENQVACDGKHHTSAANAIKKQVDGISSVSWHNDGKNGVDDPNSSLKILLDWLTVPANFQKYRGDNKTGLTKSRVCANLAKAMNEAGVRNHRDGPSVRAKICRMESAFKKAHDWAGNTGVTP